MHKIFGSPPLISPFEAVRSSGRVCSDMDMGFETSRFNQAMEGVKEVVDYASFKEMFDKIDFRRAIPEAETVEDALAAYHRFYSKEDEVAHGVLAIIFEVVRRPGPAETAVSSAKNS